MAWELSKENLQPLKRGREPAKLEQRMESPACLKDSLETKRRGFWEEIAKYTGPDPLDPWLRFIKWTQQSFSAGGHQAELVPLLERCTRELQKEERYKDDIRYLRVWIQYADCLPEPRDVFTFLRENNIGQDFALYYIAFAAYLELRGNFAKAEAVFNVGLERMAVPVEKLRAKYEDFQERMERRKQRKAQDGTQPSTVPEDENGPVRQSLGVLRAPTRGAISRSHTSSRSHAATGVQEPKRRALTTAVNKENSTGGLEIFVDDEFRGEGAPSAPDFGLASQRTGGAWDKLSTFESTRKENEQQAAVWTGNKFKQKKALMPAPAPPLEIPVDDDLKDQPPVIQKPQEGTLRQRLETAGAHHLDEDLQHDPLRLFKHPELAADTQQQHQATHPARKHAPGKAQLKKGEAPGYDMAMAMREDGEEISFEEVRAQNWLSLHGSASQPASPTASSDMDVANSPPTALPPTHIQPAASSHAFLVRGGALNTSSSESDLKSDDAAPSSGRERTAAFNTLNAGRTGPLNRFGGNASLPYGPKGLQPFQRVPLGDGRSIAPPDQGGDLTLGHDVTANTQEAYAAINSMFRGSLPHDCSWNALQGSPGAQTRRLHALPEPTVTISTKAAFDAVNQMFGATLPHESHRPQRSNQQGLSHGGRPLVNTGGIAGGATPGAGGRSGRMLDDQTEGLIIYEDTDLLDGAGQKGPWTPALDKREGINSPTAGFAVYEDTEFGIGQRGSPTGGFSVYEDTDFRLGRAPSPVAEKPEKHAWAGVADLDNAPPG